MFTYVDNVLLGANSVQNAYEIYLESKDIFKRASMNLRVDFKLFRVPQFIARV